MTTTSAPNRFMRVLAVVSILLAGLCGGLIGYVVTDLQCAESCPTEAGIVGLVGAIGCAAGVAVVAVLALRAAAEWNQREARERAHQEDGLT